MKKTLVLAFAALAIAPMSAQAETICAPSDPLGFYACAGVSVSWNNTTETIVLSVQNLDSWNDMDMTSWAGGYLIRGIGITGDPSIAGYLLGTMTVTTLGGVYDYGNAGNNWSFETDLSGNILVEAGADTDNAQQKGSIVGCTMTGSPSTYFQTCEPDYPGFVQFNFATKDYSKELFDRTSWTYSMRGIAGENEVSFKCGTTDDDRDCLPPSTVTPEPVSMLLMATGLLGVGIVARRRRQTGEATES